MKERRLCLALMLAFFWALMFAPVSSESKPLEDGFYRVLQTFPSEDSVDRECKENERILGYNPVFADTEDEQEEAVVVEVDNFVPLQLQQEPEKLPDQTDRTMFWLGISLTPEASERFEAFTRDNLGQRVAVVVGGKVVTMHGVKEVIKGGKIQISRCGDRGCEILFRELEDNVGEAK